MAKYYTEKFKTLLKPLHPSIVDRYSDEVILPMHIIAKGYNVALHFYSEPTAEVVFSQWIPTKHGTSHLTPVHRKTFTINSLQDIQAQLNEINGKYGVNLLVNDFE